jgi:hypothetical protein
MNTLQRTAALCLVCIMVFAISACGGQPEAPAATNTPSAPAIEPAATELATQPPAPTATLAPTPTPRPPTPTPAPVAGGGCDNRYYPVAPGLTWIYSADGPATSTYTVTLDNITDTSFTMVQTFEELVNSTNYLCTPEGLMAAQYGGIEMAEANIQIETLNGRGVLIPSEDAWRIGETWDAGYDLVGTIAAAQGMSGTITGTVSIANEIVAQEKVTVPAGTFDAFRVDAEMTQSMLMNLGAIAPPQPFEITLETSSWYAPGVGLVKSATDIGDGTMTTIELQSFKK